MKNKGITLVALVITIVILLILSGISISALTQTEIFGKAKQAEQKSKETQAEENALLGDYENKIDKYIGENVGNKDDKPKEKLVADNTGKVLSTTENTELKDEKGNKIVVPAGFKITNDATTVDKGIVVEDATVDSSNKATATNGSQFVWVPVGTITKADGTTTTINLDRYTFEEDGKTTAQGENVIYEYDQELTSSDKGNKISKNITDFKDSVSTNCGYYIGRYEARTVIERKTKEDTLTQITVKKKDYVYNYVTQVQAAEQAQKMYNSTHPFTSDLINSYAWDTAIVFIQNFASTKYSRQASLNTDLLAETGTTNDVQCNIFDMASNMLEWTTETSSYSGLHCVSRGGSYNYSDCYAGFRINCNRDNNNSFFGFRPILYL